MTEVRRHTSLRRLTRTDCRAAWSLLICCLVFFLFSNEFCPLIFPNSALFIRSHSFPWPNRSFSRDGRTAVSRTGIANHASWNFSRGRPRLYFAATKSCRDSELASGNLEEVSGEKRLERRCVKDHSRLNTPISCDLESFAHPHDESQIDKVFCVIPNRPSSQFSEFTFDGYLAHERTLILMNQGKVSHESELRTLSSVSRIPPVFLVAEKSWIINYSNFPLSNPGNTSTTVNSTFFPP